MGAVPEEISNQEVSKFVAQLEGIAVFPAIVHPDFGPALDVAGASKALGNQNRKTLSVWRSTGRYPELEFFRIGKRLCLPVKSVMQYLRARR